MLRIVTNLAVAVQRRVTASSSGTRDRVESRLEGLRLLRQAGRGAVATAVASWALAALLPLAFTVASGIMVGAVPAAVRDGLESAAGHRLLLALTAVGLLFFVGQAFGAFQAAAEALISLGVNTAVRERVMTAALHGRRIEHLEDPAMRDLLSQATKVDWRTPGGAVSASLHLVPVYLQTLGAALLVAVTFSWWVAGVLLLIALTTRLRRQSKQRRLWQAWERQIGRWREADYLADVALRPTAAKELRLFDLGPWLRSRYRARWLSAVPPSWAGYRHELIVEIGRVYLLGALAGGGTVALAGAAAVRGELQLGELVIVVQSAFGALALARPLGHIDQQILFGMVSIPALRRFERETAALARPRGPNRSVLGMPAREVRLEDVRFRYPGTSREILCGLDLTIPAGESLAIVGLNGAGKTTLVKLLAGLYEPTAGRILVDGVDLRELDLRAWQQRLAVIFQDFVRYETSAAENIRFGALGHGGGDATAVVRRAAELAGIADELEALPLGFATVLSRGYEDGVDLSGGQWQRVALARALFAVDAGAGVLVLDEPTASLDVRAEARLFDRFLELTAGLTTILISHRFSTVRHASRICVIEHGRVCEQGTHADLLALGGRYAALFRLQAEQFNRPSAEEPARDA